MKLVFERATPRERLFCWLCALVGLLALAFLWQPASLTSGIVPPCPSIRYAGFTCAGCGTLRATQSLIHGRPLQAWAYNPLFVLFLPGLGIWAMGFALCAGLGWKARLTSLSPWWAWGVLALFLAYMVLRNLPFPVFEAWRPRAL